MVLDLVLDGFSCISMFCIIQNLKIPGGYPILGNIKQKWVNFAENGSQDFKSRYLVFHVFE